VRDARRRALTHARAQLHSAALLRARNVVARVAA
jgi:hypothetical protein